MQATYSPDDNKLRIYPDGRLDTDDYERSRNVGFLWAPKQKLFVCPRWTPQAEDFALELAGTITDEDTSLVDRAKERAERFTKYSEHRNDDAQRASDGVHAIADNIPFGQPILIGHHSEKRARRDQQRITDGISKAVKMWDTAQYWQDRAASAVQDAKYKERPDVRVRRIKKIKADLDRTIRCFTPKHPNQISDQTPWSCPVCQELYCDDHPEAKTPVPHVYCGASRGGSWVPVSSLGGIKARSQRWVAHYENRLVYEKAMLEDQGASDLLKPKARPKQLPLLNYRAPDGVKVENMYHHGEFSIYAQEEMTRAEYKRMSSNTRTVDGHRIRVSTACCCPNYKPSTEGDSTARMNHSHATVCVFLTDSKEHPMPVLN